MIVSFECYASFAFCCAGILCAGVGTYQYFSNVQFFDIAHPYNWLSFLSATFFCMVVSSLIQNKAIHDKYPNLFTRRFRYLPIILGSVVALSSGVAVYMGADQLGFWSLLLASVFFGVGELVECAAIKSTLNSLAPSYS